MGVPIKQQVYDGIKQAILRCEYLPGSQLNEDILCQRFNASRTPVRDALSRLEQEGLVSIQSKRGIAINPVSLRSINELFEVRLRIEPYSVLTYGNRLSEDVYASYLRQFAKPCESREAYHALDSQFHYAFIDVSNNRYLNTVYRMTADQNERYRILSGVSERLDSSQREHYEIGSACLCRDWKRASVLMQQHINNSRNSIISYVLQAEASGLEIFKPESIHPSVYEETTEETINE